MKNNDKIDWNKLKNSIFKIRLRNKELHGKFFDKLVSDIIERKCILMIGAGISKKCFGKNRSILPNWYQFLEKFINWQYKNKKFTEKEYEEIKILMKNQDKYQIVAGDLLDRTSDIELRNFLEEIFSPREIFPSYLHKLLCYFPFRGIITTNYDTLIEKSYYEVYGRFPKVIPYQDINNLTKIPDNLFIAKIHGDIEEPSSIILSQIDYMNLIHKSPAYLEFLKNIFSKYTILFTGYSLNDPDIRFIINELSFEGRYSYLIVRNDSITDIECERFFKDNKIVVICYEKKDEYYTNLDIGFEQILDLLPVKKSKYGSTIIPFRSKQRINILVLYGKKDRKDGEFLIDYFYRNKHIIVGQGDGDFKYQNIIKRFDKVGPGIDIVIIYLGKANFIGNSSNFMKSIKIIENNRKKYNYKIVILSIAQNKKDLIQKFPDYSTFYLKQNFSDINLKEMHHYIENLIENQKCPDGKVSSGCIKCAYYQSKYEKFDENSLKLLNENQNLIKKLDHFIQNADYIKALEIIETILDPIQNLYCNSFVRVYILKKIDCYFDLKQYDECIKLYEDPNYHWIKPLPTEVSMEIALSYSLLGNFEQSIHTANEMERDCKNISEKLDVIHMKIDIYENCHECIENVGHIYNSIILLEDIGLNNEYLKKLIKKCLICQHLYKKIEFLRENDPLKLQIQEIKKIYLEN